VRAKAATAGTALVPILGARTVEQLDDNLGALGLSLDNAQLARLDAVSAVPLGFPHEMLASDQFRHMISGCADIAPPPQVVA
jgi:diketogulonate reductase-like aldo/keto reductase